MRQPPALPLAIIVAGPTASGKSALALALAQRFGGTVINADSMQVYAELPILTAQPGAADREAAPHALYGVRWAREAASVAWWREAALAAMASARGVPVLCGGTGLYLRALTHGLAGLPPVPEDVRREARASLAELGAPALHARLAALDPATAAVLRPSDAQRVARAWEVLRATGRGLRAWQADAPRLPAAPWRFVAVRLDPPREALRAAIDARFGAMLEAGALAEVASVLGQGLDRALPAMRAHGVPELSAYLAAETSLAEARRAAVLATGRYTKRQATWFRHHLLAPEPDTFAFRARIPSSAQDHVEIQRHIVPFVQRRVDALQHGA